MGKSAEKIEIYKIHAELADRVSQRRLGTHRVFASLSVSILLFIGILIRIGEVTGLTKHDRVIIFATAAAGAILSILWQLVIRSYRELNKAKFLALGQLESDMEYRLFRAEWEFLGYGEKLGENSSKYVEIGKIECYIPSLFCIFYISIGVFVWQLL